MASDGCQPIIMSGRATGYNKDNQNGKISFPAGVTNYRDLRTGGGAGRASTLQSGTVPDSNVEFRTRALYGRNNKAHEKTLFNDEGIPVGVTNCTGSNYSKPAGPGARVSAQGGRVVPQQAAPPAPLATSWGLPATGKSIYAVGWQCSASDAAAAVSCGCALIDAGGDLGAEKALGVALSTHAGAARPFVVTSVPLSVAATAAAQCTERLGGAPDMLVLALGADDDINQWPVAAAAALAAAPGAALALGCASPTLAVQQLNAILGAEQPHPVALRLALNPTSPKVSRMLVGALSLQLLLSGCQAASDTEPPLKAR